MIELWIGIALLVILAVVLVCIPMFVRLRKGVLLRGQTNIDIYKQQLKDLDRELNENKISEQDHQALSDEVKHNLLIDAEQADQAAQTTDHTGGKGIIAVLALLTIVTSVGLYTQLGSENELVIKRLLESSMSRDTSMEEMRANADELIERLSIVVDKEPEDVEAWYLLGRIQSDLGRYDEAVLSFSNALQYLNIEAKEDRGAAMAQLAQAQFFANGRKLDKATESLLKDALAINPRDSMVLGLLGVASYESQNYLDAVRYWQRLLGLMPPTDPNAPAIQGGIYKAKSYLSDEQLAQLNKEKQDSIKASINVTVSIDESMAKKMPADSDLFVMAKADKGPPMPLAVQRINVTNWPVTVTLDDSMAMMESLKLSEFENVVITARISKHGVGNAKPGDLQGQSSVISSSDKAVKIVIDSEL